MSSIDSIISPNYLVGGSVRDELLGKLPHDFDFATPLLPDNIEDAVRAAGKRPYITGKRFGTIGFKMPFGFVEVTTFRNEVYEPNSRRPEVEFVDSIDKDLARRDFTINAIAKRDGRLIDPFGGQSDIKSKLIRAVGNPSERFNEDPLRMLRAARFAAQLGFEIDPATHKSITKNTHKILQVSKERWMQELDKLMVGDRVAHGLEVLWATDLMKFVLPELRLQYAYEQNSDYHNLPLHQHTIQTVAGVPPKAELRWAALLHDVGKPFVRTDNKRGSSNYVFHDVIGAEMIYGIGKRMKWSNERLKTVMDLVKHHLEDDSPLRQADNAAKETSSNSVSSDLAGGSDVK